MKSENNNPWFKPWFNILLHTQSIVCASVDSQCLEYLGYITLGRVRNSAHLGCQELAVLEICRIHKWTTMNSNLGNRFSPLRKRSFHLFSILLFFPTTATTQEAIVHLVWLIRNYNFGFGLFDLGSRLLIWQSCIHNCHHTRGNSAFSMVYKKL